MEFRKKPVVVKAWLIAPLLKNAAGDWNALPKEVRDGYDNANFVFCSDMLHIKTLEGTMKFNRGDMLITGVKGEIYPCKPDIFAATYEQASP